MAINNKPVVSTNFFPDCHLSSAPKNTSDSKINATAPKALILTNHMADFGGSEIVALEVSELLVQMGYDVHLHCNYLAAPVAGLLLKAGISACDSENFPNVFGFDFVWSQHNVLALALSSHAIPTTWTTQFISVHLSPFEPFELTGIELGKHLGSTFVANSEETAGRLEEFGVNRNRIVISHNASPDTFWIDKPSIAAGTLKHVLLVSNHPPQEISEALEKLAQHGVSIRHMGRGADHQRVTPEHLANTDAVITIGKTVQYAIQSGKPVYCYDHFGGPGWLTAENFDLAEIFNFSGRGYIAKKSSDQIFSEITEGHAMAASFISQKRLVQRQRYSLATFIETLTRPVASPTTSPPNIAAIVRREAIFCTLLRRSYRNEHAANAEARKMSAWASDLGREIAMQRMQSHQVWKNSLATEKAARSEIFKLIAERDELTKKINSTLSARTFSIAKQINIKQRLFWKTIRNIFR